MLRFTAYLSKSFSTFWLGVVFGFLLILGLLDSLANGGDIMAVEGAKFSDTFRYMLYRLPVIFDRIFMFTLVLAILLVFVRLIRNHELVALIGFGLSVPKQIVLLVPIVVTATVLSITVINFTMPRAVKALQNWGIGEYQVSSISEKSPLWLEDGLDIIRAEQRIDQNTLGDLQIFTRDAKGAVTAAVSARRAVFDGSKWILDGAEIINIFDARGEVRPAHPALKGMSWQSNQTPDSIARLSADPRDLSLADMGQFRGKGNSGSKPRFAYDYWYKHRLSRPLAALALLICCVPLMQKTKRQDTGDLALLSGSTIAFIYLIFDAAMATFAINGSMKPMTAVLLPIIAVLFVGTYLVLRTETLGRSL